MSIESGEHNMGKNPQGYTFGPYFPSAVPLVNHINSFYIALDFPVQGPVIPGRELREYRRRASENFARIRDGLGAVGTGPFVSHLYNTQVEAVWDTNECTVSFSSDLHSYTDRVRAKELTLDDWRFRARRYYQNGKEEALPIKRYGRRVYEIAKAVAYILEYEPAGRQGSIPTTLAEA